MILLSFTLVINNVSASVLMIWPTDSKRVTSYYGPRDYNGHSFHQGIDIGALRASVAGDRVMAVSSGKVAFVRWYPERGHQGFVVAIDHKGPYAIENKHMRTIYAHLVRDSNTVVAGQYVERGQTIAKMGGSGIDSGGQPYPVHLHFETRICTTSTCATSNHSNPFLYIDVRAVNPTPLLQNSFSKDINDLYGNDLNLEGEYYDYEEIKNMTREEKIAIGYLDSDEEIK